MHQRLCCAHIVSAFAAHAKKLKLCDRKLLVEKLLGQMNAFENQIKSIDFLTSWPLKFKGQKFQC